MNIQTQEKQTKAYITIPNDKIIVNVEKIEVMSGWVTIWADNGKSYSTHLSNVVIINTPIEIILSVCFF